MRILIKTIIIVITIFVLLMVYGLFSMNYGFASSINNVEWDIFTIKNLKILEIGNSCFISFEPMNLRKVSILSVWNVHWSCNTSVFSRFTVSSAFNTPVSKRRMDRYTLSSATGPICISAYSDGCSPRRLHVTNCSHLRSAVW